MTDLDGHTLEELGDYLDRGMTPAESSIDSSPGCRIALRSLARLREVSASVLEVEAAAEPARSDAWITSILSRIGQEARAGREIPLGVIDLPGEPAWPGGDGSLSITEGAVRALIRGAGDSVRGVLVGRTRLDGDVTLPGEPITVDIDVSVFWGHNIREATDHLRAAVRSELARHTELEIAAIDITVHDITRPATGEETK